MDAKRLGGAAIAGCLAVAAAGGGCAAARPRMSAADAIAAMLHDQAAAWNDGDVERFMEPYWHSPELTFSSGGKVTRGWRATLDGYRQRYPDRAAMGHLTFSDLEVTPLGGDVALVLGRWYLDRDEPVGGAFSLVLRRIDGRWVIVHDHTSRDLSPGVRAGRSPVPSGVENANRRPP